MGARAYVAIDLGAESGRVIIGTLSVAGPLGQARLELLEVHRFVHEPIQRDDGLYWNVPRIWDEIFVGLSAAAATAKAEGTQIISVGVDAWGVDFVLLDRGGEVLSGPRCYRDARWEPGVRVVRERLGFERSYQITGIQELTFNTLPQLATARVAMEAPLETADRLLMLPDYFHHLLGGAAGNEASIASTSQMIDASTGDWSAEVISAVGISQRLFARPYLPGMNLGSLRRELCARTGLSPDVRVVAPASHDTASAVAGVPAAGSSWAYLSSGTWSLLGVERGAPILAEGARRAGFTNERGVANTIRFHKNVIGLWLVQEVRRDLERRGVTMDYSQLTDAAAAAQPFRTLIDASHPSLAIPGGSVDKIRALARSVGQPEPGTPGELVRCCLEALAIAYRRCLEDLESLVRTEGRRIDTIHVVGGGSKNVLLNQMTADATGRRVLAGPAEATAAGNVLVQAMVDGQARDLASIRAIVAHSFSTVEYKPRDTARWDQEYARYRAMMEAHT